MRRPWSDESGVVGGFEAIPFGLLIFVIGTLLVANAWGVIDAKLAVGAAAREGARAYVEAQDPEGASRAAAIAALTTIGGHGRNPERVTDLHVPGPDEFFRCSRITVEVFYEVPALPLPWIDGLGPGAFRVRGTHSEIVDPYRDGVPFAPGFAEAQC